MEKGGDGGRIEARGRDCKRIRLQEREKIGLELEILGWGGEDEEEKIGSLRQRCELRASSSPLISALFMLDGSRRRGRIWFTVTSSQKRYSADSFESRLSYGSSERTQ